MEPYRILVVDDSPFMRAIFSDLIMQHSDFTIIGTAANGEEGVEAVKQLQPDAVTLDLEMPQMNGLEALQTIMKETPTPVVMLSGISEQNTKETIKALQYGAIDFIRKPTASDDIKQVGELLIEKLKIAVMTKKVKSFKTEWKAAEPEQTLKTAASIIADPPSFPYREQNHNAAEPSGQPAPAKKSKAANAAKTYANSPFSLNTAKPKPGGSKQNSSRKPEHRQTPAGSAGRFIHTNEDSTAQGADKLNKPTVFRHVVAIGTSTGGPRALHEVISGLPADLPAPVLVVQHMPPKFTKSLAQRLDSFSQLEVVEAAQGERVRAGVVYIAPGGSHMELAQDRSGYCIKLTEQPPRNGHRPSVDVLFESLVPYRELDRHAVIMTGMGSDGAKGMAALAESGAVSAIAEAEETCIVYGMPRCAIENGSAKTVLPLQQIASNLVSSVTQ
ncbi:protein-glutamate methylesterase/protein-glutamine glutaminase [Paenibacillus protaetiae]|uniref:Protein-glutamate methylesterase/protein-glutamine glutaminase n=1 Tax=Paenibacillus protaetiae TaxID=2509456 RepID=A0A4P6ET62_9BACL|nr:chemotaxis response regulator protein-glutamate methylesterase [Paenibacillus protaetiae]QAY65615.1 chemotaxis response regulator protein-glutamate methylesterase [Paenibacillus protaetiae]